MGEKKKVSKAQIKATMKYTANHYDRIVLTVPKGKRETIKAAAAAVNESMNEYCNKAVDNRIKSGE